MNNKLINLIEQFQNGNNDSFMLLVEDDKIKKIICRAIVNQLDKHNLRFSHFGKNEFEDIKMECSEKLIISLRKYNTSNANDASVKKYISLRCAGVTTDYIRQYFNAYRLKGEWQYNKQALSYNVAKGYNGRTLFEYLSETNEKMVDYNNPELIYIQKETEEEICEAANMLTSRKQRRVVFGMLFNQESGIELAKKLGVTKQTIRTHFKRGIENLNKKWYREVC